MATYEYTPQEDARFDHLTDAENHTYGEARDIIMRERQAALARQSFKLATAPKMAPEPEPVASEPVEELTQQSAAPRKRTHYSRRGGRSYPEPSDSELDPYWNGRDAAVEYMPTEEDDAAFEKFIADIHDSAASTLARIDGISYDHAVARLKSHKKDSYDR